MPGTDGVDRVREYWAGERPDWDTSPIDVFDRVLLIARHYDDVLVRAIAEFDVSVGGLDVLATLRRVGPPYTLTPTGLRHELLLSSGAMTHRLDKLEERGLIKRKLDPEDRRGFRISLTSKGLAMIEDALLAQYAEGHRILASFSGAERGEFVRLMRKLQGALDEEDTRLSRARSEAKNRMAQE